MAVFRTRSLDPHVRTNHTMVVALRQAHNHIVMAGESLRHRPVSDGTRQLFLTMFASGMTPPQALALHQSNLLSEYGDIYQQVIFVLLSLDYLNLIILLQTNFFSKPFTHDFGVVVCLGRGADLQMAQLMPLPLTISCFSKSRLVLPSWFYLSGTGSPG